MESFYEEGHDKRTCTKITTLKDLKRAVSLFEEISEKMEELKKLKPRKVDD